MAPSIKPLTVVLLLAASVGLAQQQVNDPDLTAQVEHPAFTKKHPRIGIDEAHRNFHTRDGRYKPFAALMESDGFVVSGAPHFDARSLKSVDILVIANAMGEYLDSTTGAVRNGAMGPAFTLAECDAVRDWVRGGGALLLIADHVPWGDACFTASFCRGSPRTQRSRWKLAVATVGWSMRWSARATTPGHAIRFALNPSLVLAPESALSLLPSRGLSSAPAACSVSPTVVLGNDGPKKELDNRGAFRHVDYRATICRLKQGSGPSHKVSPS
jgi:hypothetical protein